MSTETRADEADDIVVTPDDAAEAGQGPAASLGRRFLEVVELGFLEDLDDLVADDAVMLVPGRSAVAGLHEGRASVIAALGVAPAPGVSVTACDPLDLVATDDRAVAIVGLRGRIGAEPFEMEVAFHLQVRGDRIVGITEYSGDQYLADRLTASAATTPPTRRARLTQVLRSLPRRRP